MSDFIAPTFQEVQEYVKAANLPEYIDYYEFWLYYTAVGWKFGKNDIKDWRAVLILWIRRAERYAAANLREAQEACLNGKDGEEGAQ